MHKSADAPLAKRKESDILSPSEKRKLDLATRYINARTDDAANNMIDIGKYLLAEFYENDISRFHDRAPRKSVSLRKLADREDINITYVSLCYAVRLAIQERRFFSHNGVFQSLTPSHKVVLLQVESDGDKVHYAKEAVEKKLSVRQLRRQLVSDGILPARGPEPKRIGPTPSSFKKLIRMVKPFSTLQRRVINEINVSEIPARDRARLKQSALQARDRIDALIRQLT